MNKRLLPILALLTTSIIWGVAGPVIKATLPFIPPFTFLFFRFLITVPLLLPFFIKQERAYPLRVADYPQLFLVGFFGMTLNLSLIFLGFERTSAIEGTLLLSITPILVTLSGWLFLKEEITKMERTGTLLAFLGALLIVVFPTVAANATPGVETLHLEGNILILLADLTWVVYTIYSKQLSQRYSPLTLTYSSFIVGLLTFAPLAAGEVFILDRAPTPNSVALGGLLYMALISLALAYFLYEWGLRKIEASETAVFAYLQPLFAFPAAFLLLGEIPILALLPGILLTAFGVILANL